MIKQHKDDKSLITFLLHRWQCIIYFAALERVYIASKQFAKDNGLSEPEKPTVVNFQPERQIEIIRRTIVSILPEAKCIDYKYEAPVALDPTDFIEMYVSDHKQCISKVKRIFNSKVQATEYAKNKNHNL